MKAIIEKIKLNSLDTDDQIQFRIEKDDLTHEVLNIRRGNRCNVKLLGLQRSLIDEDTGEVKNNSPLVSFVSDSISISLCVLENGMIAVITVSIPDKKVCPEIVGKDLKGRGVEVEFL